VELDTLSDWVTSLRSIIRKRIFKLSRSMSSEVRSIFNDKDVIDNLTDFHSKYVVVPADKASNNIVFVCKTYYIDGLVKELGINNNTGNPTYTPTSLSKDDILSNHKSVISSFGLSIKDDYVDLPSLYWIPKLHKCPYKERYIAGSAKCSTKSLSKLLTTVLSTVKDGLQTYCDTAYSRNGINQIWILKIFKDLVESLSSQSLSVITSIKSFDFSTFYTTIPNPKLKSRLKDLVTNSFMAKSGKRRYSYLLFMDCMLILLKITLIARQSTPKMTLPI